MSANEYVMAIQKVKEVEKWSINYDKAILKAWLNAVESETHWISEPSNMWR